MRFSEKTPLSASPDKTTTNSVPSTGDPASPEPAIMDLRPEAVAQRKLQHLAQNSNRMLQLKAVQQLADNQLVQRKKNTTGLPDQLKSGVEQLSGLSMDDVKVHYNSAEPAGLQAHAYALGTDIHVAPGQEEHLPHEAWHVVQQKQGRVRPTKQLRGKTAINDDTGLEREADVMGEKAAQLRPDPSTELRQIAPTGQAVAQRAPIDFAGLDVLTIAAKTGPFRTSYWEPLQQAVRAYSQLTDPIDTKVAKKLLREIAIFAQRWKIEHRLTEKDYDELTEDEQQKTDALEDLEIRLRLEQHSGIKSGRLVTVAHTAVDALNEPELTERRSERDGRKRGYFVADTQIKSAANLDLQLVAAETVCRVVESTVAIGGQPAKNFYKVRPAPESDATYGTVTNFPEGYVRKDAIDAINLEKSATGKFHYEDRFSPDLHPLFQGPPSVEDVMQSSLGNCWMLGAILTLVRRSPQHFTDHLVDHGDGVVSVKLYEKVAGIYQPKVVDVKKSVAVKTSAKTTLEEAYNKHALWVQMVEKAWIMAGFSGSVEQDIPSLRPSWTQIEGGVANFALAHLTGRDPAVHHFQSTEQSEFVADQSWVRYGNHHLTGFLHAADPTGGLEDTLFNLQNTIKPAIANLKNGKDEVRLQDAEQAIRSVRNITPQLVTQLLLYMRTERIYPDKRGKAKYTDPQLEVFTRIINGVRAGSMMTASTRDHMKRGENNFFGRSGNESTHNGLAGPHAYEIIDFSAHGLTPVTTNPTPDRICWIKLRNPWGDTGRIYKDTHTGLDMDETHFQPVQTGMEDRKGDSPEFWVPLEDFTKRFHRIVVL